jgi:hypothetical protein
LKVKEFKDIIAWLSDPDNDVINGSLERALYVAKNYMGMTDDAIYNNVTPLGMTLYEEWAERYASYTNLINWARKHCFHKYDGAYYMSKHSIFGWSK